MGVKGWRGVHGDRAAYGWRYRHEGAVAWCKQAVGVCEDRKRGGCLQEQALSVNTGGMWVYEKAWCV